MPLGFITECNNDADDEAENENEDSIDSDSDDSSQELDDNSKSSKNLSAPKGRDGVVVDIESLDAGGSLD